MRRIGLAALLLSGLLAGCGEDKATPSAEVVLTTVLPAPATPGQEVTLYGRLPEGAAAVVLTSPDGQALEVQGSAVRDGVRFTVPETLKADLYELRLPNVETQRVTLDVVPRLDRVTLDGQSLKITGAGWGITPDAAAIEVNGQRLTATADGTGLQTTVNAAVGREGETASELYGVLNVRVVVGERASETRAVSKAAVSVTGEVKLPVTGTGLTGQGLATRKVAPPSPSTTLLIAGSAAVPSAGLLWASPLSGLGYTEARYRSVAEAVQSLSQLKAIGIKAEYDGHLQVQGSARLPVSPSQLQSQAANVRQWFWPLLGVTRAWTRTRGEGVTVAVVDTGVTLNHPDLKDRLLPGRDFVDGDRVPQDVSGHGTHVTGLIGADGAVMGAAPGARLLPVRVIGPNGGTVADLVRGLLWAAGLDPSDPNPNPAQVINLSLGTPEYSEALQAAVKRVLDAGVILVAATGNDGGLPYAPANIPGVIAVTSLAGPLTTYQPSYANRGPGTRLSAYGGDLNADQDRNNERDGILSTDVGPDGTPGYALRQGTSMATPQVSGIAALLLAQGAPPRTVKALLEGHATDLNVPGMDLNTGWGLVSAGPTGADADLYVLALDASGHTISYVHPTAGQFTLHSLPPNGTVTLLAASDHDHDGVVGEAGELLSEAVNVNTPATGTASAALQLTVSDGRRARTLPK